MVKSKSDYIEWLVSVVETYGRTPKNKIDITLPFLQLGLSSLDVVQIINDYKKWSGKDLSPTVFFEYSTIDELAGFLSQTISKQPEKVLATTSFSNEPIAIIGMSCRFPGAKNTEQFWQLLKEGKSSITELPESRINKKLSFKAYAGLLDDVKTFDTEHFALSVTEVLHMDPQQRLLLELSWEAMEDAGYSTNKLSGSKTGVYVGISSHDYALEMTKVSDEGHLFDGPGMANSIAANRLSYFYNFKGPSFAVDTACSSSLLALHMACEGLRLNQTDLAFAGGVNLIFSHYLMESFKRAQMLSDDGKCKTFSDDANGYVRSEGGGFVILKRLSEALKDKDFIHAVIRGSAINQDGRTNTITAPNGLSQTEVIKEALHVSGVQAQEVTYVETHGTGTPLGDPIEYSALKKVFQNNDQVYIGSVKTNIGHTEAAAGIAAVIKTVLCLKNSLIPKHLHFSKLNSNIDDQRSPLKIPLELIPWNKAKKIAGVSSFGFGGTNAHAIFEEAPLAEVTLDGFSMESPRAYNLFAISASSNEALKKTATEYLNFIKNNPDLKLADLCANIYQQRSILAAKFTTVVKDLSELKLNLENFIADKNFQGESAYLPTKVQVKLALNFSSNDLAYDKIGKQLYESFPVFRSSVNESIKKAGLSFSDKFFNKVNFESSFIKLLESLNMTLSSIENSPTHILEIGSDKTLESKNLNYAFWGLESVDSFLKVLATLFCQNVPVDLTQLIKDISFEKIKLPLTQYSKKTYWLKAETETQEKNKNVSNKDFSTYLTEIKDILAQELKIDVQSIDQTHDLMNLGADSLVMMNCLDIINEKYDVKIGVSDLFQGLNNLENIAKFVTEKCSQEKTVEVTAPVEITKPVIAIDTAGSGKGVLGNFSTKHFTTHELIDEQKKKTYLEQLIQKFTSKIKNSKEHTQKYRQFLADNRASAGFRPHLKEMVYPIVFKKAQGAHFEDIDGNEYIDFTMGFGVNLFGHSPKFIQDALRAQLEEGVAVGPQSYLAGKIAKKFSQLTGMERVAFVNSGTEAIMTAVRLARAATKREKVVIFEGSYHGHFDGILGRRNTKGDSVPVAPGVPKSLIDDLIVLEYGSNEALDYIEKHGAELAAVMVEPVQSRYPEFQPVDFLKKVRELTRKSKTAFIFDEVITGFRIAVGGAQEQFGIKADLATYGKILGGGMPIGAVAGSKFFMDFIDGGDWEFGNNTFPKNELTFFAGTFCKHPFAMAATYEVLTKLDLEGKGMLNNLNLKTTALCNDLNNFFKTQGVALELVHFGTLFRFKYQNNMDWLFFALNLEGIYIWEGRNMFLSTAHSDKDIAVFIEKVKRVVSELLEIGYIPKAAPVESKLEERVMIDSHQRFIDLTTSVLKEDRLASQIYLSVSFKGALNEKAMLDALDFLVKRYDSFQADYDLKAKKITFGVEKNINVGFIDLSALPDASNQMQKWLNKNSETILEPNQQPIKVDLLKINDEEYVLSLVVHHLVMDGLSIAFMTDDLAKVYTAYAQNKVPDLKTIYSFADFLANHENKLASMKESADFWKQQSKTWRGLKLKDVSSRKGSREKIHIDKEDYKKLRLFGYKHKSSLLITSLTALFQSLNKTFKEDVFTVGIPAAGHTSIKDPMVGNCVNLAPLTSKISPEENISERINHLRQHQLEVFKHCDYPYERVLEDNVIAPLSVIFNVEPISKLPDFNGLKTELLTYPVQASEFPLMFNVMKLDDELHIEMDYQYSLFNSKEAKAFIELFRTALFEHE